MTPRIPATPKARELLAKLEALAERGINGEQQVARRKLSRLKRRYDFDTPNLGGADIFNGVFLKSTVAAPIIRFQSEDFDIANSVKWAIETRTGIECLFRGDQLMAQAAPSTANRLHSIAGTIAAGFSELWKQFRETPTITDTDRRDFVLGLYEGMMDEVRVNEPLPSRIAPRLKLRAKKRALGRPSGIALHPYSIAHKLGAQIRFSVPLDTIAGELESTVKGQIESKEQT